MTSDLPKYKGLRIQLALGKYRVLQVRREALGTQKFSLQVNNQLLIIDAPADADVREGDLLTLYTEVGLVLPKRPSVQ